MHHQAADVCQQGSTAQPKECKPAPKQKRTPKQVVSERGINVLGQVLPSRQLFGEVGRLLRDTLHGLKRHHRPNKGPKGNKVKGETETQVRLLKCNVMRSQN